MAPTGKLSSTYSRHALEFARENVPGFAESFELPVNPLLALTSVLKLYITGTEDVEERAQREDQVS